MALTCALPLPPRPGPRLSMHKREQPSHCQYWSCPCSLLLGSRQAEEQLPIGSSAIQPLANGQNPTGHLLAGSFPIPRPLGYSHLSGPLPSWSLLRCDWQVSLCQAEGQVLGTASARLTPVREDPGPGHWPSRPRCRICLGWYS